MPTKQPDSLQEMRSPKSPTRALAERARTVLRRVIDRDFGGNQAAAARAWKVRPPTISNLLNENLPPSFGAKFFEIVLAYDPDAAAEILGFKRPELSESAKRIVASFVSGGMSERVARWSVESAAQMAPEEKVEALARVLASTAVALSPEPQPAATGRSRSRKRAG